MADIASAEGRATDDSPLPKLPPDGTADGKRRWLVLIAMVFGLFMPMLDNLAVNSGVLAIQQDLNAEPSALQWIVDAYTLTFASLMLIGGSLGDTFGRKKFFVGGLVLFTAASLACGIAQSAEQMIAFRAVQGLGAALLIPGSLSILTASFLFLGRGRGAAIGIWAATSGVAVAAGPVVGHYILEHYSWQTIFFINIPIGIVSFLLTAFAVRESRDISRPRRIDMPGVLTGTAGLSCLVYALIKGGGEGWTDDRILGAFAAAAVLLLLFIVVEIKSKNPMVSLGLFRSSTFTASNLVAAAAFFALFGATYILALYLQDFRGFSPLETGVRLVPFIGSILLISPIVGKLSDKHGYRGLMTLGCLYSAGGLALLLRIQPSSSYAEIILPALVVLGFGMALTLAPMTAAVMGSVDPLHAGAASAITNTIRQLGGVLGIAVLGTLVASPGRSSLVDAIHSGLLVAVAVMLLAALIAASLVRSHLGQQNLAEARLSEREKEREQARKAKNPGPLGAGAAVDAQTVEVPLDPMEPPTPAPPLAPLPAPLPIAEEAAEPEMEAQPLRPARRERKAKRKAASLNPVSVSDTHYHQEPAEPDEPASGNGWAPEAEAMGATTASESYHHLRSLMVDLPIKAGTGDVEQNLQEVALATLAYYQYGLSQPGGDSLPVGVTSGAPSSIREDIGILAGYLDLEKRFGRVNESLATDQAAARLMEALGFRALEIGAAGSAANPEFVRETVRACLRGEAPVAVSTRSPETTSGAPESTPAEPTRLVYRRRGTSNGPQA